MKISSRQKTDDSISDEEVVPSVDLVPALDAYDWIEYIELEWGEDEDNK